MQFSANKSPFLRNGEGMTMVTMMD